MLGEGAFRWSLCSAVPLEHSHINLRDEKHNFSELCTNRAKNIKFVNAPILHLHSVKQG